MTSRLLLALLLGGCVYYNGMYNANRLAQSARKAEQDGRTFEANDLWGQVATKAESVVARHPTSKYAGEAAVLRGVALARLGQCEQALSALSSLAAIATPADLVEDALLATGRCQVTLGNLPAADAAFSQVLESKNTGRRLEARFQHARLLRQAGRYDEALSALTETQQEPRAATERLLALAGTGRTGEALALADSLIAQGDTTRRWDSVVVALGSENPVAASSLVERVRALPKRSAELQARLLLDDGLRLVGTDTARAVRRFREAVDQGASGEAAGLASLALVRLDLSRASRPEDLAPITQKITGLAVRFERIADEINQLEATVTAVYSAGTTVTPNTPQGDLRLFLAAESARDSLTASRVAEALFRRILEQWSTSPYAPKAVLAAQQLDSTWADSARALLEQQYGDSPYLAMIRGETTPTYRQLEDSLGAFAAALAASRQAGLRQKPGPPARVIVPGRRPQPPAGGARVPEPQ